MVHSLGVVDVVGERSEIGSLNYKIYQQRDTLTDSAMVLVLELRALCGEEAYLWLDVVSAGHPLTNGSLSALSK